MITSAVIAAFFYFVYSGCLGVLAGLVYRYEQSWGRYIPGVLVALYYVIAWAYPHRVIREARAGTDSPGEDWRFTLSAMAFAFGMFFLIRILRQTRRAV